MALAISSGLVAGKTHTPRGVVCLEQPSIVVGLPSSFTVDQTYHIFLFAFERTLLTSPASFNFSGFFSYHSGGLRRGSSSHYKTLTSSSVNYNSIAWGFLV